MTKSIQAASIIVTDPIEIAAVKSGEINGEIYSDGDVYADVVSLLIYRHNQILRETPHGA